MRWGRTSPLALDTYLRKERLRVSSKGVSSLRKYRLGADSLPGAVGQESVRVCTGPVDDGLYNEVGTLRNYDGRANV